MTLKSIAVRGVAIGLTTLFCSVASAQQYDPQGGPAVLVSSSSTTTTIVGGVILTIVMVGKKANLETYLRSNAVALRHEITQGGGATVSDLADAFGVADERRAQFAHLLRRNREALIPLLDVEKLTAKRASKFAAIIADKAVAQRLFTPAG